MKVSVELNVSGMHCGSCGLLIDESLEEFPGVIRSAASVRNGKVVVSFDASQTNPLKLCEVIASLGYQATAPNDHDSSSNGVNS